jgi:hypothetical protein
MGHVHTMNYYPPLKKKKVLKFINVNDISQILQDKICVGQISITMKKKYLS